MPNGGHAVQSATGSVTLDYRATPVRLRLAKRATRLLPEAADQHGKSFNYYARPPARTSSTEAFLVSVSTISVAEIGDRTQLLSLVLSARYRRPLPILGGILCATLANDAAAGLVGNLFGDLVRPRTLQIAVGVSMIGMALLDLEARHTRCRVLSGRAPRAPSPPRSPAFSSPRWATRRNRHRCARRRLSKPAGRGRRHHPRNADRQRAGRGLGQGVRRSAAVEGDSLRRVAPVFLALGVVFLARVLRP